MEAWKPATGNEVERLLAEARSALHPNHVVRFDAMRVTPYRIPVQNSPGEFVYVVAAYEGNLLYYSDIEGGWEIEVSDDSGGIRERGSNQFTLSHIMYQLFGEPDADPPSNAV